MRLSVVIPAFNEALRLPSTLETIVRYLNDHPRWLPAEVVVVDDGSSDETAAAVVDGELDALRTLYEGAGITRDVDVHMY